MRYMIQVAGMHCGSCERLIDEELRDIDGVLNSVTRKDRGMTMVEVGPDSAVSPELLERTIARLGFRASLLQVA